MFYQLLWLIFWPLSHIFYAPKAVGLDLKQLTWKRATILITIILVLQIGLYFLMKDALAKESQLLDTMMQ
jgi:hypothetical protein